MNQKRTYCNEIMLFIADTFSTHLVTCIHLTDNGVKKSWLDGNMQVHSKIATDEECNERTPKKDRKNISWLQIKNAPNTFGQNPELFDNQNHILCLRIQSPIDHQNDDIFYTTIRSALGSININVSEGYETSRTVRDDEIIASMCYRTISAMIKSVKNVEAKIKDEKQSLVDDIVHKQACIKNLKREKEDLKREMERKLDDLKREAEKEKEELKRKMEIPANKTLKIVKKKLSALSELYGMAFSLSKDAENMIKEHAGENLTPILEALEHEVVIKLQTRDTIIDDTDLRITREAEPENLQETPHIENPIEERHSKVINYLENIENAYNIVYEKSEKTTSINITAQIGISPSALSMYFKKHKDAIKLVCNANPDLCKNTRKYFEPLKKILGRNNPTEPDMGIKLASGSATDSSTKTTSDSASAKSA